MIFFSDFSDADDKTNQFVYGPEFKDLPEAIQTRLKGLTNSPSPVDRLSIITETIYANPAKVNASAKDLGAAAASFMAQNGFFGMGGAENRGGRIAQALRRDAGFEAPEGTEWPDASTDPAVTESYVVPDDAEEPEEPVA